MTLDQIVEGLTLIVLQLGNSTAGDITIPPLGFEPHEWAYVKGLASGEILGLRDRLLPAAIESAEARVPRGTCPPSVGLSERR